MKNMVSIIIPTYNRSDLLIRSVKSVLKQTYTNIEIVVVDDNSSDNTFEKIKKINDKRVRYFKLRKNHGACYARNLGIIKARGDYIAFQDSDDVFLENKIEFQLNNLLYNKSDLDFCKLNVIVDENTFVFPNELQESNIINGNVFDELCDGNAISTQAILARRDVFDDIKFDEDLPRFQDYDLALRIASKYKISYSNKILANVYRQDDSISNSDLKLKDACIKMLKKDYGLNKKMQQSLDKTLLYWLTKNETDKVVELTNKYHNLENSYDNLSQRYESLINSKRVKFLYKILGLFNKK